MKLDYTTAIGLLVCVILIIVAIYENGSLDSFIQMSSILITVGGSICAVVVCFPIDVLSNVISMTKNAFFFKPRDPQEILRKLQEMSNRARREGTLALEDFIDTLDDDFFARGVQLVVDGHEPSAIEDILYNEIEKIKERHQTGVDLWEAFALLSPAFGMIGTLIGLVNMLGNLSSDMGQLGPNMATALLTTLYGSLMANIVALPLSKKLKFRSSEEAIEKELIAQGLLSILVRESPRFLVERLNAQLAPSRRLEQIS